MPLHPDDLTRPATLREIKAVLARMQDQGWRAVSLEQALDLARGPI